jgi:dTDP-4-dehydrorhamnose 3,5-epimerase
MLKGITIKPLKRHPDERGFFSEVMRTDWKDLFQEDTITQANVSISYPTIIRAWHRHLRGQTDYFLVLEGAIRICAYDEKTQELDEIISTDKEPQIVRMPGIYWHGFKVVGHKPAMLLYFTTRLYDHANPDEERKPWDDPKVVPKTINGNKKDPRAGQPWNWNRQPHG